MKRSLLFGLTALGAMLLVLTLLVAADWQPLTHLLTGEVASVPRTITVRGSSEPAEVPAVDAMGETQRSLPPTPGAALTTVQPVVVGPHVYTTHEPETELGEGGP
jgi:hypothetical protein